MRLEKVEPLAEGDKRLEVLAAKEAWLVLLVEVLGRRPKRAWKGKR